MKSAKAINFFLLLKRSLLLLTLTYLSLQLQAQGSGNCLGFDGANDYVDLGGQVGNNCRTIELWFKLSTPISSSLNSPLTILFRDYNNANAASLNEYGIFFSPTSWPEGGGHLCFDRHIGSTRIIIRSDSDQWQADRWYHVAGTIDPVNGMRMYVNGILQQNTHSSTAPVGTMPGAPFDITTIGKWGYPDIRYLDCQVDELRFWTTHRTAAQIRENMCKKLTGNETGLKAYYRFDQNSGTILPDLTGNNYNGQLYNMTNADWVTSGAPIGDTSSYLYPGAGGTFSNALITGTDTITITSSNAGIQLYRVNSSPNSSVNLPSQTNSHYYGAFLAETGNYDLRYSSGAYCSSCMRIYERNDNAQTSWSAIPDTVKNCVIELFNESKTGQAHRAEYILTDSSQQLSFLPNDTAFCMGDTLTLDVSGMGSAFLWQDNSTDSVYRVTQSGTYWVNVTSSLNSCGSRDSITIIVDPVPTVDLGNDTSICEGDLFALNAFNFDCNYLWNDNSTAPGLQVTKSGIYWVRVNSVAANCTSTDTIEIEVNESPFVNLGPDTVLCQGDSLLLDASYPGAAYLWQDNSTAPTFLVTSPGAYSVIASIGACQSNEQIAVTFDSIPVFDLGDNNEFCEGDSLLLEIDNQWSSYLWSTGDTSSTITLDSSGIYWLTVTNGVCSATDSIQLKVNSLPERPGQSSYLLCDGEPVMLDAGNPGASYRWSTGDTSRTLLLYQPAFPEVTITLPNGCSLNKTFVVAYCKKELFIPNTITPNGDGKNDSWIIRNIDGYPGNKVLIFNRNGYLLFETTNYQNNWNGTYEGEELPATVYYYVLDLNDGSEARKGTVTIVREK